MKVTLIIGMIILSSFALLAQDSSHGTGARKKASPKERAERIQKDESTGGDADMIRLKASDVPVVLRKALQSAEYSGWDSESSAIYGSEANDLFVVEIGGARESRTYYFDGDGKLLRY